MSRGSAFEMLQLDHLSKTYADGTRALADITLAVEESEIVAILGGSGCGKTTLLRLIAGLDQASRGVIEVDGAALRGTHAAISAVFQEPRLLPWLDARANIAFGGRRLDKTERAARTETLLGRVGLAGYG